MKVGQKVFVCHDGKWSRRVVGEVIKQHNGHHITVKFELAGESVVGKFRKRNTIHYLKRNGRITWMSSPKHFEGWVDVDYFCPWFSVYKMKGVKP